MYIMFGVVTSVPVDKNYNCSCLMNFHHQWHNLTFFLFVLFLHHVSGVWFCFISKAVDAMPRSHWNHVLLLEDFMV